MAKKIRMVSTGVNEKGNSTGYIKTTCVPDRGLPNGKLEKNMFDPRAFVNGKVGGHVLFKEEKIK